MAMSFSLRCAIFVAILAVAATAHVSTIANTVHSRQGSSDGHLQSIANHGHAEGGSVYDGAVSSMRGGGELRFRKRAAWQDVADEFRDGFETVYDDIKAGQCKSVRGDIRQAVGDIKDELRSKFHKRAIVHDINQAGSGSGTPSDGKSTVRFQKRGYPSALTTGVTSVYNKMLEKAVSTIKYLRSPAKATGDGSEATAGAVTKGGSNAGTEISIANGGKATADTRRYLQTAGQWITKPLNMAWQRIKLPYPPNLPVQGAPTTKLLTPPNVPRPSAPKLLTPPPESGKLVVSKSDAVASGSKAGVVDATGDAGKNLIANGGKAVDKSANGVPLTHKVGYVAAGAVGGSVATVAATRI